MTRTGASKPSDATFSRERLQVARAFLHAAQIGLDAAEEGDIGNPAISHIVHTAIAYTDALTARYAGRTNQQDHAAAIALLRSALGKQLPAAQETKLKRILGLKDAVQYGASAVSITEARKLLTQVEQFAEWAESLL